MLDEQPPLVSIITPCRNAAATLKRCLDSVAAQDYPRIEHIVIDDASSEDCTKILRAVSGNHAFWISEPDQGIYDALNKGIAWVRGSIIGFLNADDWYEPDAVSRAVAALQIGAAAFTCGPVAVHANGAYSGTLHPLSPERWIATVPHTMPIPHVSMFVWRSWIDRIGVYDQRYRIAGDHDFVVRLVKSGALPTVLPEIVAHIDRGGGSDSLLALRESHAIARRHGAPGWKVAATLMRYSFTFALRRMFYGDTGKSVLSALLKMRGSRHVAD